MIEAIANKINLLKQFQLSSDDYVLNQVRNNESEILDLNLEQLNQGIKGNSQNITPSYRPKTIQIKQLKGQPTNRVTLKDTGDFYQGFEIVYFNDRFVIDSEDEKAESLENKYGLDIFGLTDRNIQETIDIIRDDFIEAFRKLIL